MGSCLFGVDSSYSTGNDSSMKNDETFSIKKGKTKSDSTRHTNSSSRSSSVSNDLTFDTYPIYFSMASDCVKRPKTAFDFDLSAINEEGVVNLTLTEYYDAIAKNNQPISKADMDENKFKKYIGCLAYNGARMAQANIDFSKIVKGTSSLAISQVENAARSAFVKSSKISDSVLRVQLKQISDSLNAKCVFVGTSDKIKCGGLDYTFSQNQLQLGNSIVYGYNTMFGVTSQFKVAVSDAKTRSVDVTHEEGKTFSKDFGANGDTSDSSSSSSKQDVSIGKFIPAVQ